jgi:hypothetical protein
MRALLLAIAAAAVAIALVPTAPARTAASCPATWRPGWQALADRIHAPVYCPSWMPNPLDGDIRGQWRNGDSIKRDRSYWISFLSHDAGDVHVNFRGYPGRTRVPTCVTLTVEGSRTIHGTTPCFATPRGHVVVGAIHATLYTVNQDADQWHLLYAWRHAGSLYAVSEHVIPPYTDAQVRHNLLRILRGLELLSPRGA